uniref:Ig-like domain-containing protein n=1 Tax=Amazona collaria TaxID=241587 RepID=A0A8B9G683_9PSIT
MVRQSRDGGAVALSPLPAPSLLSPLLPGTVHGVRETVLGTVGKATTLRIPPDLQNLTLRFGAAVWKRDTEDPQSKLILLQYSDGNYTNYVQDRTRFHELDFSLEILNTSRQDGQLYEYRPFGAQPLPLPSLSAEPVSDPSIQILSRVLANGTCSVTLNCTAERGDSISYRWGSGAAAASGLCSRNSSLLRLSFPLRNSSISCSCTASNPVSAHVVAFNSSQCSSKRAGESVALLALLLPLCSGRSHTVKTKLLAALSAWPWVTLGPVADPIPSLPPIPGSAGLGPQGLLLVVVVPIAAVMLIGVLVAVHVAKPSGECHAVEVLGVADGPWLG